MSDATAPPQPPPIPRSNGTSPRICVLVNLAAFPGLGTIMAGRWIGYLQAALMLAGFALTMGFLLLYLACICQFATHGNRTEIDLKSCYQPHRWMLLAGLTLTITAWLWAAHSSLAILRQARIRSAR